MPVLDPFWAVFVSGALFCIGAAGFLIRKNLLFILMSLELMLNAVNLNLIAFSRIGGFEDGPALTLFVTALAAAEAGVGLALAIRLFKVFKTMNVRDLKGLREAPAAPARRNSKKDGSSATKKPSRTGV